MKKSIIVLLIAVLVAGFAFAGKLTGSAALEFNTDLEKETWGFENSRSWKYTFKFEYDTTKVNIKGETDAWAELAISATAYLGRNQANKKAVEYKAASGSLTSYYNIALTKATINFRFGEGDDAKVLVIGLLNAGSAVNYVSSYGTNATPVYTPYTPADAEPTTSSAKADVTGGPSQILPGFTVTFDKIGGGLGAKGKWDDKNSYRDIFAHIETAKPFEFAEGAIAVNAGAYAVLSNYFESTKILEHKDWENKNTFGGGLKVHYGVAADEDKGIEADKLQANVAADLSYDYNKDEKNFKWEVGADVSYLFEERVLDEENKITEKETLRFDLYLTQGKYLPPVLNNAKATVTPVYIYPACKAYYTGDYADAIKLDAKVSYGVHRFAFGDSAALLLSGSVEIKDALVDKRELIVSATEDVKLLEKEALSLSFTETYKALVAKTLDVTAAVTYTAEKFVAKASVSPTFQFADSKKNLITKLGVSASITTKAIVDKAELGLTYSRADFAKVAATATTEKIKDKGLISAYAKIAF